jgi:hypothetical protein
LKENGSAGEAPNSPCTSMVEILAGLRRISGRSCMSTRQADRDRRTRLYVVARYTPERPRRYLELTDANAIVGCGSQPPCAAMMRRTDKELTAKKAVINNKMKSPAFYLLRALVPEHVPDGVCPGVRLGKPSLLDSPDSTNVHAEGSPCPYAVARLQRKSP